MTQHFGPPARIDNLLIVIDNSHLSQAFSAYRQEIPAQKKEEELNEFLRFLADACAKQATEAKLKVQVVIPRPSAELPLRGTQTDHMLVLRATSFTTAERVERYSSHRTQMGWTGATSWEANLFDRRYEGGRKPTWTALLDHVNLLPVGCGGYDGCAKSLTDRVFAALRSDGLLPR